jgi:hypothetical protein
LDARLRRMRKVISTVRHANAMITRASVRYDRVSSTTARRVARMRGTAGRLEADTARGRAARTELSRITRPLPDARGLVAYALACRSWAGTRLAYAEVAVSAAHEAASAATAITQMGNC